MSAELSIPQNVREILRALRAKEFQAFVVGGAVRDLLRGEPAKEFDVATSARPEQVQQTFKKVVPTGIQHGTVTVLFKGASVEVTTFRSEGAYLDGRHPSSVVFETDIKADLSRRDFTINAMAYDPESRELVDPFGGQADLQAKVIRCVGNALDRFTEDGLRPMRAVRFASVLGFDIAPDTLAAIPQALPSFRKVSTERVRDELSKLLLSPSPAKGIDLLRQTGMLEVFLPEATNGRVEAVEADLDVRLAAILVGKNGRDIALRLKFPNKTADRVGNWLAHLPPPAGAASDPDLRRFLADLGPENLPGLLQLAPDPTLQERCEQLLAANPPLHPKALALKGQDIMRILGTGPGPKVGDASRFLFQRVLDDPSLNTPEQLTRLLTDWTRK